MTFNDYQRLAARTMNPMLSRHQTRDHALCGIASEAGEINAIFQKGLQGHPIKIEDVKEELGDLLWFAAELATVMRIDLDEVAVSNIEKLKKRYPDGFDSERSVHRDE